MKNILTALAALAILSCNSPSSSPSGSDENAYQQDTGITPKAEAADAAAQPNPAFDRYCNAWFGYCVDYPAALIYPQPESENGDGRVFKNRKGEEILRVFGRHDADPDGGHISLEQQYNEDLHGATEENGNKDRVITYQKLGKTFFVISGLKKGRIFYQKTILKDGAFAYAILQYDEAEKATFDKISETIFKSFN